MAEAVGMARDEQAGLWVSVILLAGMFVLFLLQLPGVMAHAHRFSPWLYVPGLLAFFVAAWKKSDAVVMMSIFWLSLYFMIDLYFGVSLF
jgi:hypothetical protein